MFPKTRMKNETDAVGAKKRYCAKKDATRSKRSNRKQRGRHSSKLIARLQETTYDLRIASRNKELQRHFSIDEEKYNVLVEMINLLDRMTCL